MLISQVSDESWPLKIVHKLLTIFRLYYSLLRCARSIPRIPVHTDLAGQKIRTTVDSEVARYYLEHYLKGDRFCPKLDAAIDTIEQRTRDGTPSQAFLKSVATIYSTDFSTLVLWQHLLRDPVNKLVQNLFAKEFSWLKADIQGDITKLIPEDKSYLIVFAPGWLYKSNPENGGDFAKPRKVLADAGIKTALLKIQENGTVERNADFIAEQLIRLGHEAQKVIVVSVSKAGPEVALALTRLHQSGTPHTVKVWMNVGGVLHGTALVDTALTWPMSWYVRFFLISRKPLDGIVSLTTGRSAKRAKQPTLPPGITVVNYVGIPLSGQVSDRAKFGYSLLRSEGPNDGLTLILDEIPSDSITIAELGLDHFFYDPEIHIKTVALINTVIRYVEARRSAPHNSLNIDARTSRKLLWR